MEQTNPFREALYEMGKSLEANKGIMTKEEYKKNTNHAVELIKAMNEVVGTNYSPEFSQEYGDTDSLLQALSILQTHIDETIKIVKKTGESYSEAKIYELFVGNKEPNRTVKWGDVPQTVKNEIKEMYGAAGGGEQFSEDAFSKTVEWFKTKYNVGKIEL
jgi:hypothetical protein